MINFNRRFKKQKTFPDYLIFFLILTFLTGLIFILNLNFKIAKQRINTEKELKFLTEKKDKLKAENQDFLNKESEMQTNEYLERSAREDFNLKKQGEEVVSFPIIKSEEDKQGRQIEKQYLKKSFFQKFLEKIFGKN